MDILIIKDIDSLRAVRREWRLDGCTIGFVPTMGNLHAGHLNLVTKARATCDKVVVSIFVNPLQFGPDEDLEAYPRTVEQDTAQLSAAGADVVFLPSAKQMYPNGLENQTFVEVPGLSYMICGASRPGHFRGVATIVCKLFNMVQPNDAFFGQKDYQQLQVIRAMVEDLSMNVSIHGVPTVRASDGLALSSRNQYLSADERHIAPRLYQELAHIGRGLEQRLDMRNLIRESSQRLTQQGFKIDYLEVRQAQTLQPPSLFDKDLVVLAAAFLGRTRLIDNLRVNL